MALSQTRSCGLSVTRPKSVVMLIESPGLENQMIWSRFFSSDVIRL